VSRSRIEKPDTPKLPPFYLYDTAVSGRGTVLVGANCNGRLFFWDLRTLALTNSFDTRHSFGGTRLALSLSGDRVVVGSWGAPGVTCFDTRSGDTVWQRKDLRRTQHLNASRDGRKMYCGFDETRSLHVLSFKNGRTLDVLSDVAVFADSAVDRSHFVEGEQVWIRPKGSRAFQIERSTFAVLDHAFGKKCVAISEVGGPISLFRLSDGVRFARYSPEPGCHCLALEYDASRAEFVGFVADYEREDGASTLLRFTEGGDFRVVSATLERDMHPTLCVAANVVVTGAGAVIDLQTGTVGAWLQPRRIQGE
jgi:hypothetical protein